MNELAIEFKGRGEVRGYDFRQICTNGFAYVYEVKSDDSDSTHYEVFERKENKAYNCVSYPTGKAFGRWAYCPMTLDKAMVYYEEFTERVKMRNVKNLTKWK